MPSPSKKPRSQGPGAAPATLRKLIRGVGYWAPVWIPSILLWQFTANGLQPALQESRRLKEIAPEVHARHAEAKQAFEQVQAEALAWQDPVYQERRRRMRFQEPQLEGPPPQALLPAPGETTTSDNNYPGPEKQNPEVAMAEEPTWPENVISPAEFLERFELDPATGDIPGPMLTSEPTWDVVDRARETTAWTASEPSWTPTLPPSDMLPPQDPAPAQASPDSPLTVD